jgi:molybdate transport system substrate-binding protein
VRTSFSLLLLILSSFTLWGEQITLYAAAGVKAPLTDLAGEFERTTGTKIVLHFDTAGAAEQQFYADPGAGVLVTTQARLAQAVQSGKLSGGTILAVGDTVAGFAAAQGSPKPDLSTSAKLREALLATPTIAFSDPARGATVGTHFLKVIQSLGIQDEVMKKATLAADGVETMKLVQAGKVALGITQTSEIVQADPQLLVGPFPPEFDLATTYALWTQGRTPGVQEWVKFLNSPASRARLQADGLRSPAP